MQQTPQDACCQQLIAQAGWPSSLLHDGGFARLLDRLHQQGFHQRGWGLDHWQIPLSRGIIRHREVSFFSFKDSFEKDCPLFFPFWQPLSVISWSRWGRRGRGVGTLGSPSSLSPSRMENRFFERLDRDIVQVRKYSNTQKIK